MAKVVILKAENYGKDLDRLVSKAMQEAGFKPPKKGMVLVKTNILRPCGPKDAVITNPEFVKSVVKEARKYNKNVVVGDGVGKTRFEGEEKILGNNGTEKAVKGLAAVRNFDDKSIEINIKNKILPKIKVSGILKEAKYKISVAKMKTHLLTVMTGAVKNHYGYLYKDYRTLGHAKNWKPEDFSEFILDVYLATKSDFSIMDGIVGMEGEGPGSGNPIKSKVILASTDAIALDYVASKIMGINPNDLYLFKKAIQRGVLNPHEIEIIGEKIEDVKINFKNPTSIRFAKNILAPFQRSKLFNFFRRKITVDKNKCIRCGKCAKACPAGAITMKPYPVIDSNKCIRCFCCMEHCPENALSYKWRL